MGNKSLFWPNSYMPAVFSPKALSFKAANVAIIATLMLPGLTSSTFAQTTEEKVKQLQDDIALLKLQNEKRDEQLKAQQAKAAADAAVASSLATVADKRAAAFKSAFPTDKVTPLQGNITADKEYSLPPYVLSYSASEQMLSQVAAKVVQILRSRSPSGRVSPHLLIYSASDSLLTQRAAYDQMITRIGSIDSALDKSETAFGTVRKAIQALPQAKDAASNYIEKAKASESKFVPAALAGLQSLNEGVTAVNSTVQTIIQLISLFRTDTTITGLSITLDVDALSAQIGHLLQSSELSPVVEYPSLLVSSGSPILAAVGGMEQKQAVVSPHANDIDSLLAALATREQVVEDQIKLQAKPSTPPTDQEQRILALATKMAKDDYQTTTSLLADVRQRITSFDQSASALDKALQSIDEKTSTTPLAGLVKTETILLELRNPNTYSLLLKPVLSGGATKIDKNFFTGSKISQLGGAIFVATLTDSTGKILFTNVSKGFLGYSRLMTTGGGIQQDLQPTSASLSGRRSK